MAQAGQINTTRRAVFGGAAQIAGILGLAALPGIAAAAPAKRISDAEFIRSIAGVHRDGALAARQALASGMRPENLWAVVMPGVEGNSEPALCFTQDGESYTVRPTGLEH